MFATGLGFAGVTAVWPLFIIAVVGTLNPSSLSQGSRMPSRRAACGGALAFRRLRRDGRAGRVVLFATDGGDRGDIGRAPSTAGIARDRHHLRREPVRG